MTAATPDPKPARRARHSNPRADERAATAAERAHRLDVIADGLDEKARDLRARATALRQEAQQ